MPITASIQITQGASPTSFVVTDVTSFGAENITNRTLTILDSDNLPLTGYTNPIPFSIALYPGNAITISGLTADKALSVKMDLTASPIVSGSVYTVTKQVATNRYLQQGLYNIQKARFLDNALPTLSGTKAQLNSIDIIIEQENSQTAVLYGSLVGAQDALDRGQVVINNQIL